MMRSRSILAWTVLLVSNVTAAPGVPPSHAKNRDVYLVPAADILLSEMVLAAKGLETPVLLFDPQDRAAVDIYLDRRGAPAVRCFHRRTAAPALAEQLAARAKQTCTVVEDLGAFARTLWPAATIAIAVSESDREGLLRSAALSATYGAALWPITAAPPPTASLFQELLVPPRITAKPEGVASSKRQFANDDAFAAAFAKAGDEPPTAIIVTNSRDTDGHFSPSGLSLLAPLASARHRAPLVLVTESAADRIEREALSYIDRHQLNPTHIILVGDELALRSHAVADPVLASGGAEARGGGTVIRVELFSEIQHLRPQDYVVGRIVAESASAGSVALARQIHGAPRKKSKPVIFLTNADEVFPLGETISRSTIAELQNVGVQVRPLFRGEVTSATIQKALGDTELLVWEGHSRDLTLEERGGIAATSAPDFVFLQGCYTLDRSDPFILMEKGTQAIVASSAAIYSAPGSAFARSVFDSLLHDSTDLGTAVRNGRNYLLALALLQRDRDHAEWTKTYRAALAFALWGDPKSRPNLRTGQPTIAPTAWTQSQGQLQLTIPAKTLPEITVGNYRVAPPSRSMLGGLLLRDGERTMRRLKELFFLTRATPQEQGQLCPSIGWDVVNLYAPRTGTMTTLARPDWTILATPKHSGTFKFAVVGVAEKCPN